MLMTVYKVGNVLPHLTDRETEASCGALTCLRAAWLAGMGQAVPVMCMRILSGLCGLPESWRPAWGVDGRVVSEGRPNKGPKPAAYGSSSSFSVWRVGSVK